MSSSCYRCGAAVEEQTTFCPACGAPQIRVTVPAANANSPSTPPLPPGTPESVQPPAMPLNFQRERQIQWRPFLRIALPLSFIGSISIVLFGPLGLIISQAIVGIVVWRYSHRHGGLLRTSQGAILGALSGLFSFVIDSVFFGIQVMRDPAGFREQMTVLIQQRLGANPDPAAQQVVHWALANFTEFVLLAFLFGLVLTLAFSGIVGTLSASLSGRHHIP